MFDLHVLRVVLVEYLQVVEVTADTLYYVGDAAHAFRVLCRNRLPSSMRESTSSCFILRQQVFHFILEWNMGCRVDFFEQIAQALFTQLDSYSDV